MARPFLRKTWTFWQVPRRGKKDDILWNQLMIDSGTWYKYILCGRRYNATHIRIEDHQQSCGRYCRIQSRGCCHVSDQAHLNQDSFTPSIFPSLFKICLLRKTCHSLCDVMPTPQGPFLQTPPSCLLPRTSPFWSVWLMSLLLHLHRPGRARLKLIAKFSFLGVKALRSLQRVTILCLSKAFSVVLLLMQ